MEHKHADTWVRGRYRVVAAGAREYRAFQFLLPSFNTRSFTGAAGNTHLRSTQDGGGKMPPKKYAPLKKAKVRMSCPPSFAAGAPQSSLSHYVKAAVSIARLT